MKWNWKTWFLSSESQSLGRPLWRCGDVEFDSRWVWADRNAFITIRCYHTPSEGQRISALNKHFFIDIYYLIIHFSGNQVVVKNKLSLEMKAASPQRMKSLHVTASLEEAKGRNPELSQDWRVWIHVSHGWLKTACNYTVSNSITVMFSLWWSCWSLLYLSFMCLWKLDLLRYPSNLLQQWKVATDVTMDKQHAMKENLSYHQSCCCHKIPCLCTEKEMEGEKSQYQRQTTDTIKAELSATGHEYVQRQRVLWVVPHEFFLSQTTWVIKHFLLNVRCTNVQMGENRTEQVVVENRAWLISKGVRVEN